MPQTVSLGIWRLNLARDSFPQEDACRIHERDGKAIYRGSAVGFRFNKHWGVSSAVYRFDGSEPRFSRDESPDFVTRRMPMDQEGEDNSATGLMWAPCERLTSAHRIVIESHPGGNSETLHFGGLVSLHDLALKRGCAPDNPFVKQ